MTKQNEIVKLRLDLADVRRKIVESVSAQDAMGVRIVEMQGRQDALQLVLKTMVEAGKHPCANNNCQHQSDSECLSWVSDLLIKIAGEAAKVLIS